MPTQNSPFPIKTRRWLRTFIKIAQKEEGFRIKRVDRYFENEIAFNEEA